LPNRSASTDCSPQAPRIQSVTIAPDYTPFGFELAFLSGVIRSTHLRFESGKKRKSRINEWCQGTQFYLKPSALLNGGTSMKNIFMAVACVLFAAGTLLAAPRTTVWRGTLVDSNCYLKDHALTGNDHMGVKQCGTACLKTGLPAGILTSTKQFHVLVAPSLALAPYVGDQVRVTGTMHFGAIQAEKVEVRENGKWQEVQLKSMM
jgi:hypothetical protein